MRYSYKSVTIGSTVFVPELMDIFLGGSDLATHNRFLIWMLHFTKRYSFFAYPLNWPLGIVCVEVEVYFVRVPAIKGANHHCLVQDKNRHISS